MQIYKSTLVRIKRCTKCYDRDWLSHEQNYKHAEYFSRLEAYHPKQKTARPTPQTSPTVRRIAVETLVG